MKKALLLCALAAPGVALADDGDMWYLTPNLGAINPDHGRSVKNSGLAYGIDIGKEINEFFNVEADYSGTNIDTKGAAATGTKFALDSLMADGVLVLNRAGTVSPFLLAGIGAVHGQYKGNTSPPSTTSFGAQVGAGALFNLWESPEKTSRFSLRPEIKARWNEVGSLGGHNYVDLIYTLGVQFAFGGSPVHAPEPPAPPAPPAAPPPPPAPVAAPPPPPAPPAPPPPPPMKSSITLTGVNFATDKADLTPSSLPYLDDVATELKKHPGVKVEIQGHTDSTGSAAHNLSLSDHRAAAVRDYLIKDGVPADQLTAKGYGETKPIASNKTKAGRAQNRRTVMEVVDKPADVTVTGEDSTHP